MIGRWIRNRDNEIEMQLRDKLRPHSVLERIFLALSLPVNSNRKKHRRKQVIDILCK